MSCVAGDEGSLKKWQAICAASRKEFAAIYERLGVNVEERGESFYNPMLKGVVEELKEKVGMFACGCRCVCVCLCASDLCTHAQACGCAYTGWLAGWLDGWMDDRMMVHQGA